MALESPDFNFSSFQDDSQTVEISVDVLLREYADGRRRFINVDLKSCDLSGARLPLINLEEALLSKANLTGASLAGANLNHVDLSSANLTNANLIAADLVRAKLAGANLAGAVMSGANLSGANLRRTNLTGCSFAGANLSGVDFSGATLKNVNLGGTNLKGANLSEVDLCDIDLDSLNLEDTILAENVAAQLWAATPTTFGEEAEVPRAPDETFYQDFSEPPVASFEETSLADYAAAAFSLEEPEAGPFADALNASATTTEAEANGLADIDAFGYIPDADASSRALEIDPLADFPSLTESEELPFDLLPEPEASTIPSDVGEPDLSSGSSQSFAIVVDATEPDAIYGTDDGPDAEETLYLDSALGSASTPALGQDTIPAGPPSPTDLDQSLAVAPPETAAPRAERSSLPPDTSLLDGSAQAKPHHSLSDPVVQSIQAALGRRVQYSLQRKLMEVYQQRCAITGCAIAPLLETALIVSNDRSIPDHPCQGLVLRSDLKTLYGLKLLAIHPKKLTVLLAPSLLETDYSYLQGQKIRIPQQKIYQPDSATLAQHLDGCKWYSSNYDQGRTGASLAHHSTGGGTSKWLTSPPVLAVGLGSAALVGLIGAVTALQRSNLIRPIPVSAPVEQPSQAADNAIHLEASDILYRHQGVIVDGNAYLRLSQAEQLDLPIANISAADRIDHQGQPYFKVTYLRDLNIPIAWNPETRTVILDCCAETAVEKINLKIDDRTVESAGVIINNTAYVPVSRLNTLNVDLTTVAPQDFLEYEGVAYLKASSLKDLSVQLQWDAATRTLALAH
jgi:uncharacterized protein YjbI with pentapeptide repeats